ncbi:MAG TPA: hypothetical protein DCS15_04190 [Flavobacteriales bacterium]|nr:hypothetical protein [Flavobacteriales bacterium]
MSYQVTTFPHHRSLNVQTVELLPWLIGVSRASHSWAKWEGPGFFPHVNLRSRYARNFERYTGLVQFDLDDSSYLNHFVERAELISKLKVRSNCVWVAPSFSEHGIWGLLQGKVVRDASEFEEMSSNVIDELEADFCFEVDRRVSIEPRAFRLVAKVL